MIKFNKAAISTAVLLAFAQHSHAVTDVFFNPLTQSAAVAQVPDHVNELNGPWRVPAGVTYRNLTSLSEIEADPNQSVIRVPALGQNASMFDMSAYDASGRYIFTPHEIQYGAGLSRYDTVTDTNVVLFQGDEGGASGDWSNDFGALDPATVAPNGSVIVAEEWSGQGRAFEVVNPMADVMAGETVIVNELTAVPNVSIEGLRFNHDGTAMYFVDEDRSGSIYKFVPSVKGDYSAGKTFVLVVDAFTGDVSANAGAYPDHHPEERTGSAHWVEVTGTIADPYDNDTRGGRAAADELGGTPYRRPEDIEVGYLANGHEVLYFTATEELAVYAVEELGNNMAKVKLTVDESFAKNVGFAPTSGVLTSPDNLAQDALGNIYVIEDWPNGDNKGGDIWFVRDTNNDGVAESFDHMMSNQVKGSESTGMIFNPAEPTKFIINVQHPESTKVAGGMGDATWEFDISGVVAPPCAKGERSKMRGVKTCDESDSSNFIRKLNRAVRHHHHH